MLFIGLAFNQSSDKDIELITEEGNIIILHPDRTWTFKEIKEDTEGELDDGTIILVHPDKTWEYKLVDIKDTGKDILSLLNGAEYIGNYISNDEKGVTFHVEKLPKPQTLPNSLISKVVLRNGDVIFESSTESTEKFKEEKKITEDDLSNSIWSMQYFLDEFGDQTDGGYITATARGNFSNSATTNSGLVVKFIINEKVSIKLYEYNDNPVRAISSQTYKMLVKHNGQKLKKKFYATNYSDRVTFGKSDSKKLVEYLKKGGEFKFVIYETSGFSSSSYNFLIEDASGFNIAWTKFNQ